MSVSFGDSHNLESPDRVTLALTQQKMLTELLSVIYRGSGVQ